MKSFEFSKVWKVLATFAIILAILVPAFWSDIVPIAGALWHAAMTVLGIEHDLDKQYFLFVIPVLIGLATLYESYRDTRERSWRMDREESDIMKLINKAEEAKQRK